MKPGRLKMIGKLIEYDRLTNYESQFIFKAVKDCIAGKPMLQGTEDKLEALWSESQWRESAIKRKGDKEVKSETV